MENEPITPLPEVISILEVLLAQAEQPERKQVARVHLRASHYSWYRSGQKLGLRHQVNEQLQELEAKGWLHLNWLKYEEGNILESVDLLHRKEGVVEDTYELLGRASLDKQKGVLRSLLTEQKSHGHWFDAFVSWAISQLDAGKSPVPLSISNAKDSRDMLRALAAIAELREPTFERVLSVHLFNDSKRLEEILGSILVVLKAHDNTSDITNDRTMLQRHYIYQPPEYVYVTGPLGLLIEPRVASGDQPKVKLSLNLDVSSIGLPEDLVRSSTIYSCEAGAVLTVENLTSFSLLRSVRPPSVVIIYTGGFASPTLITFLRSIRTCRPELPFLHWGDIDAGGLRILAQLRRNLGHTLHVGMDIETFEQYKIYAQPLKAKDKENLNLCLADSLLGDCFPLIRYLIYNDMKLEQEAVAISHVLSRLTL